MGKRGCYKIGGSNLVIGLDENLEKELRNELKKERPSSSNTSSQSIFKLEEKVGIKPYQGEIDSIKLNQ